MDVLTLFFNTLLEYGAIGLLAFAGWGLSAYFLFKDYKKKESVNVELKAKDKVIELKDTEIAKTRDKLAETIKELSDSRLQDLKELIGDYNQAAANMTHTLSKVADALEIKSSGGNHD